MASFNPESEEFSKMQEEALKRLEEMRRRSRTVVGNTEEPNQEAASGSSAQQSSGESTSAGSDSGKIHNNQQGSTRMQLSDILKSILGDGIKLDTDRILILALLFMLYKNKADIKLLAALAYLMF